MTARDPNLWFQTYYGRAFWPGDPRPEDINICDIARALSQLCRFNGHTKWIYSVAHHSLLVSQVVPPHLARVGLLHDASEAYLGDMVRPLKLQLPEYRAIEERLEAVLAEKYHLPHPLPKEVKHADNVVLATERRDVLRPNHSEMPWGELPAPMSEIIEPLDPLDVESAFLKRFHELSEGR